MVSGKKEGVFLVMHMPIDLFFSYLSIPCAIAVALVLWGAWKLTEPEEEPGRPRTELRKIEMARQHKG